MSICQFLQVLRRALVFGSRARTLLSPRAGQDSVVDNIDNHQSASAATWGLRNIVTWQPGLRQTFRPGAQRLQPATLLSKFSSLAFLSFLGSFANASHTGYG